MLKMGSFNVHASLHPRGKDTCICTSVARSSQMVSSSMDVHRRCIHELLHIFHRKKNYADLNLVTNLVTWKRR